MTELPNILREWAPTDEEYRAYDAINFHSLVDFRRDARLWRDGYFDAKEETDAMRFGTALHAKILEPETYAEKVAVFDAPVNEKTGEPYGAATKAYKEARDAFLAASVGKTAISSADAATVETLADAFMFHPVAPTVLGKRFRLCELAIKGVYEIDGEPVPVKGKIDAYGDRGLVDLKTTAQLDDASGRDRFRFTVYDYKYVVQLGFYHRLLTDFCGVPVSAPCWLIAFEKTEPNRVAVYRLTDEVVAKAREVAWSWLVDFARAKTSGIYDGAFDAVRLIDQYNPERDA